MDRFLPGGFEEQGNQIVIALFLGQSGQRVVHHGPVGFRLRHLLHHGFQFGSFRLSVNAHRLFLSSSFPVFLSFLQIMPANIS
jgi:hypothetical protein